MQRRYLSQKKDSSKKPNPLDSDRLTTRPFAVQPKTEGEERLPDPQNQESSSKSFPVLEPERGRSLPIQPKLTIGAPNDKYEQEADRVAEQVVQRLSTPAGGRSQPQQTVQREEMPEEDELQMKPMLQRKTGGEASVAPTELETVIQQSRSNGQSLADSVRRPMEQAFGGVNFSGVKVHTDAQSDQMNRSIQAKAFATGQDIFFRQGAYQPGNREGKKLIAHELTHVVQQSKNDLQMSSSQQEEQPQKDVVDTAISSSSSSNTIQRRIGFEVETGIPITEKVDDPNRLVDNTNAYEWHECYPDDMGKTVRYNQMTVSADLEPRHTPTPTEPFNQWSIIEMVTDPIDDSMTIGNFDTLARDWLTKLIALKQRAQGTPPSQKISATPYYVGLPSAQGYNSWDRIAPQVTIGVPLDQAGKVISSFNPSGTASQWNATSHAQRAPGIATKIIQSLIGVIPPGNSSGVQELKGLVTLMCNYLLVGGDEDCAKLIYMKNRPANIFYKSKLSDVRNNLLNFNYSNTILSNTANRTALRQLMLMHTGRSSNQPLFIADTKTNQGAASNVDVATWLDEILTGTDDQIFTEMKNAWSTDIAPDANDEVVIELRKVGYNIQHNNFTLEDFNNGLLAYMKKVYLANKAIKNHET